MMSILAVKSWRKKSKGRVMRTCMGIIVCVEFLTLGLKTSWLQAHYCANSFLITDGRLEGKFLLPRSIDSCSSLYYLIYLSSIAVLSVTLSLISCHFSPPAKALVLLWIWKQMQKLESILNGQMLSCNSALVPPSISAEGSQESSCRLKCSLSCVCQPVSFLPLSHQ